MLWSGIRLNRSATPPRPRPPLPGRPGSGRGCRVGNRLTHARHRQRLPDADLDELEQRRLRRRLASTSNWTSSTARPAYLAAALWAATAVGARRQATRREERRQDRETVRTSEPVPHPEVEGERVVAKLRDDPAHAVVLVVLEDDDLIVVAAARAEGAREGQVGAVRDTLADDDARRRRQRIGLVADRSA